MDDITKDLKEEEKVENTDEAVPSLDDMMAAAVPTADEAEEEKTVEAPEVTTPAETIETPAESVETAEEVVTPDETVETVEEVIAEEEPAEPAEEAASEESESPEPELQKDKKIEKSAAVIAATQRGRWYIVHTYSGHENKVAKTLMQRVQSMGYEERIFDALVPTRETIKVRGGKKENVKEKIFPGYILVNMDLSDEAWLLVRTTPGVTSFVGAQNKPTPIRNDEVEAIIAFVEQKDPVYKAQFSTGEAVKITDGPFSDFLGTIESIDEAKGKVKVLVSIFGRETPVELDFLQVSKI